MAEATFFARVYAAVRALPRGRVATYGQVAAMLGVPRGARAVGWALRALSDSAARVVPWHRVVGAGGRISPRGGGGPDRQKARLRAEGVAFRRGGAIDLARHGIWGAAPRATRPRVPRGRGTRAGVPRARVTRARRG